MPDLKIVNDLIPSARIEGQTAYIAVKGEIDLNNSPELRTVLLDVLEQHKPTRLVLNLAEVPYMDSSAIAVLVESLKRLQRSKGKVCLSSVGPRVRSLLQIARLDSIFEIAESDAEAMK